MLNNTIKELVIEIQNSAKDLLQESNIDELLTKEKLILIRSVKQTVLENFLNLLNEKKYRGILYLIGRNEDKKYIKLYNKLNLILYTVPDEQRYSINNTRQYLDNLDIDGICFLFQTRIQEDSINLLKILGQIECKHYAISNQMMAFKLKNLRKFLAGRDLYQDLCNWFSLGNKDLFSV